MSGWGTSCSPPNLKLRGSSKRGGHGQSVEGVVSTYDNKGRGPTPHLLISESLCHETAYGCNYFPSFHSQENSISLQMFLTLSSRPRFQGARLGQKTWFDWGMQWELGAGALPALRSVIIKVWGSEVPVDLPWPGKII